MGKIRDFKISIDKSTVGEHVFGPGDMVYGVVVVHLNEPTKVSKLEIDICGKTSVYTSLQNEHDNAGCDVSDEDDDEEDVETKKGNSKKTKESKTNGKKTVKDNDLEEAEDGDDDDKEEEEEEEEEYETDEWHFRDSQVLWGGKRGGGKKKMPIGRNEIRFEFNIPMEPLPTTFEGSMGFTRYWMEASLQPTKFEFDKKAKLPFSIASHAITFDDDIYLEPVTKSKPRSFRWCPCLPRRKVFYSFTTDRSVYHPGDSILFSGEVSNHLKDTVRGQICIYQRVTYHMESGDTFEEKAVDCKAVNDVEGMETKKWTNSSLMIPPIPPTSTSRLIDIHYAVEMRLKIGDTKERTLSIPIQISSAQVQTKSFGGFSYYCGPVPNYGKSVFGRTLQQEDSETFEATSYTPVYCYYPPIGM